MSWIEQIKNDYIITCGEGTKFKPKWLNATKQRDFNVALFDFPNVDGTLVKRTTHKGCSYDIEIYFQGENHLTEAKAFDIAALDPRAWTINHPFYGNLYVQPLGLSFDNTKYNLTKITGTVIETINEDNPKAVLDWRETVLNNKNGLYESAISNYGDTTLDAGSRVDLTETTYNFYTQSKKIITTTSDEESFTNLFNLANDGIADITLPASEVMTRIQSLMNAPFLFNQSVKEKQASMTTQVRNILETASGITSLIDKINFETNVSSLIGAIGAIITAAQSTDFRNRQSVLEFTTELIDIYSSFVETIDALQFLPNGAGIVGVYLANAQTMMLLSAHVNFVVANAFNLLKNSRQERTVYSDEDSNAILLCHRYCGLTPNDDTVLEEFIDQNNIGISELLLIRAGRKIIYYI